MHALLHSGRRGARGFGLRAASLRGLPLAPAAEAVGGERPAPAASLAAGLDALESARGERPTAKGKGDRKGAAHPPVPHSLPGCEGARASAPEAAMSEPG